MTAYGHMTRVGVLGVTHQWLCGFSSQSCGDLTYLLPLDSCCLFFYVTSSIFGVKLKAVSTFTMRKGLCLG